MDEKYFDKAYRFLNNEMDSDELSKFYGNVMKDSNYYDALMEQMKSIKMMNKFVLFENIIYPLKEVCNKEYKKGKIEIIPNFVFMNLYEIN